MAHVYKTRLESLASDLLELRWEEMQAFAGTFTGLEDYEKWDATSFAQLIVDWATSKYADYENRSAA